MFVGHEATNEGITEKLLDSFHRQNGLLHASHRQGSVDCPEERIRHEFTFFGGMCKIRTLSIMTPC